MFFQVKKGVQSFYLHYILTPDPGDDDSNIDDDDDDDGGSGSEYPGPGG